MFIPVPSKHIIAINGNLRVKDSSIQMGLRYGQDMNGVFSSQIVEFIYLISNATDIQMSHNKTL